MNEHKPPNVLPRSVFFKNGAFYFVTFERETRRQKWHRLGKTWGESYERYQRLVPQIKGDAYLKRRLATYQTGGIPELQLAAMLKQSRKNARARGLPHSITIDDLREMASLSGGRCALSGLKFEYGLAKEVDGLNTRRKRPWAPSIDRIDSTRGYDIGNVRLVCVAVNIARQDFPDSVLYRIAEGLSNMGKQHKK